MIDPCGAAGGRYPHQPRCPGKYPNETEGWNCGAGANFQNFSLANRTDKGTNLPAMPSQATWKAGVAYEVGWTVMAQHGGGYSYRLAPAGEELTEELFTKLPLDFVGPGILRWDGDVETQLEYNATRTSVGTHPVGSM